METKRKQRIALSIYFFFAGVCFSTWASRIPTIKSSFNLNEAELGNLLLTMPVSSLIGLPISGWLVSRFNSRPPLLASILFFSVALIGIGYSDSLLLLIVSVFLFSFCMRILNISMNTQAITLQKNYGKKINGSFHGLWSTGGLTGVGFSTLMLKFNVPMPEHLAMVAVVTFIAAIAAYRFLLTNDRAPQGNKLKLGKPDKFILYLGLLVFFAALCEGGMFDWSGVYFKEVIGEDIFTLGYFIFMVFMALSRFFSDIIIDKIGMEKTFIFSATLIACGILMVVIFPYFWPALIGFSMVGLGVAAIIPMVFTLAGTSSKYSAGMAVSIIATYGIVGMLLGPPLIGYLANAFSLKLSFILFIITGLMLIPVSQLFFRQQQQEQV
ncbi:MFS transporter [Zunongwangia sp. F260]|uniref:MFS transporter n=1 Tax=Autumnicola lenta TaxID=3075593 RepID=A0ABU3CH45_9FLAO|nr:MFS transporter [Zunongwangia sp. F260]MDT0645668.1 MFS transporter [Zunongwangia sp. F260]